MATQYSDTEFTTPEKVESYEYAAKSSRKRWAQFTEELRKMTSRDRGEGPTGAMYRDNLAEFITRVPSQYGSLYDVTGEMTGGYGDDTEFGDMFTAEQILAEDPYAIEKAIYQMTIIDETGKDIDMLSTPFGTGLTLEDLNTMLAEYPGIESGLSLSAMEKHFEDADFLMDNAGDEMENMLSTAFDISESSGSIDSEADMIDMLGDQLALAMQTSTREDFVDKFKSAAREQADYLRTESNMEASEGWQGSYTGTTDFGLDLDATEEISEPGGQNRREVLMEKLEEGNWDGRYTSMLERMQMGYMPSNDFVDSILSDDTEESARAAEELNRQMYYENVGLLNIKRGAPADYGEISDTAGQSLEQLLEQTDREREMDAQERREIEQQNYMEQLELSGAFPPKDPAVTTGKQRNVTIGADGVVRTDTGYIISDPKEKQTLAQRTQHPEEGGAERTTARETRRRVEPITMLDPETGITYYWEGDLGSAGQPGLSGMGQWVTKDQYEESARAGEGWQATETTTKENHLL